MIDKKKVLNFTNALPMVLKEVANCVVVQIGKSAQIVKNRSGNKTWDEIKHLDFIKIKRDDILNCKTIILRYDGKNIWYIAE